MARENEPAPGEGILPAPGESKWVGWAWARVCLVLTVVLHTVAFPPYDVPEAVWAFAVPVAMWCMRRPRWSEFLVVTFGASFVSWLILLEWLRTLTRDAGWVAILGLVGLAAVMASFPTAWFAAARAMLPRTMGRTIVLKLVVLLGLAGAWVVIEWVRSWIFTGLPWLPLAASLWQRPMLLQSASFAGAWILSFAIVVFNLGLAAYLWRLHLWVKFRRGRFCPEFYAAMLMLFAVWFGAIGEVTGQKRETLFAAGFMQPYVSQSAKWDPAEEENILGILRGETTLLRYLEPDVVFWPESVTPLPLLGDRQIQAWLVGLAREVDLPLVLGAIAFEPSANAGRWSNGVFVVDPQLSVQEPFYRKRHLVPFGEYLPFRRFLPFMEKLVPIGGDFTPGTDPAPLPLRTDDRTTRIGALVCFEDVFPGLARSTVQAGAEVIFVATNNGWFGETGAAYQHAAHSVLRAVETRRPVIRVGNGGWSGWIDEYGSIRAVMRDQRESIYHRGGAVYTIDHDTRWSGRESLYVRWGDWFVGLSAALALIAVILLHQAARPRSAL